MPKVLGMVFSARTGGNLRDIADRLFGRISEVSAGIESQLLEMANYTITPCNGCQYECLLSHQPNNPCPIQDDVLALWRLASASDLLVYFLPTYGGMPPAAWIAFQQRYHAVFRSLPAPTAGKVAVVSIYEPLGTRVGDLSQNIIVHYLAGETRTLVGYEPIVPSNFGLKALRDRVAAHPAIQTRMDDLGARLAKAL